MVQSIGTLMVYFVTKKTHITKQIMVKISKRIISMAIRKKACKKAIDFIEVNNTSWGELAQDHKDWAEWAAYNLELPVKIARFLQKNGCSRTYWKNGERHREDGPAIEYPDGTKHWYLNGERHREDGPAIEDPDGTKYWYLNGERHREDGPAVEYPDGTKCWYFKGVLCHKKNPYNKTDDGKNIKKNNLDGYTTTSL